MNKRLKFFGAFTLLLLGALGVLHFVRSVEGGSEGASPTRGYSGSQDETVAAHSGQEFEFFSEPGDELPANTLDEWSDALEGLPESTRADALIAFLESGLDGVTGDSFRVGPGGRLISAPTWRVAALDWLGAADRQRARAYAEQIFVSSDSADEWALALRNYGRTVADPKTDRFFNERVAELLANDEWQRSPTAGYLEAFDAVVFSKNPEWVDRLLSLQTSAENAAVRKASLIAMESLAAQAPAEISRELMEVEGSARASAFARLDPRDSGEQVLLETYLARLGASSDEARYFFELFPNGNVFVGHFLLSTPPKRPLIEQARIDVSALQLVRAWRERGTFSQIDAKLAQVEARLQAYVVEARASGFLPTPSS